MKRNIAAAILLVVVVITGAVYFKEVAHRKAEAAKQVALEVQQEINKALQKEIERKEAKMSRDLHCLAHNIYFEAGGESYEGKVAVAQVTVNRKEAKGFPNRVCDVVHQSAVFEDGSKVCQFSWTCDDKRQPSRQLYKECYEIAKKVLIEGKRLPIIGKALFFHNDTVKPSWAHKKRLIAKIGNHSFYGV
jgi:spore germination cell wall hydrolase CwlJ-like protein